MIGDKIEDLKNRLPPFESLTKLKSHAAGKLAGPCPLCGGIDRFYLNQKERRGYCSHCQTKGGDIVDWHKWKTGKSTSELINQYAGCYSNNNPTDATWNRIVQDERTKPIQSILVDSRKLNPETADYYYKAGAVRTADYMDKECLAMGFFTLQGRIRSIQYATVDQSPFPHTLNGKPTNKIFNKGCSHDDGFFMAGTHISAAEYVVIVEGVFDAMAGAEACPSYCWCSIGGSTYCKKISKIKPFLTHSATVVVFQDNDKPGLKMAENVAKNLGGNTRRVIWNTDDPKKMDVNDFKKNGQTERIKPMIENAVLVLPEKKSPLISLFELMEQNPQIEPLIEGLVNKGDGLMVHAPGGLGKSMLSLYMAVIAGMSEPPMLFDFFRITRPLASLFVQTENSAANVNYRIRKIVSDDMGKRNATKNICMPLLHDEVISMGRPFSNPEFARWLTQIIENFSDTQKKPLDLLWIDPLISFSPGNENDTAAMRSELDALNAVCRPFDVTPVVVHHDNRNGEYRGASSIPDWARSMIGLKEEFIGSDRITDVIDGQPQHRTAKISCIRVKHEKANNVKKFSSFLLRMDQNFCFHRIEESIPPEQMEQGRLLRKALVDLGGVAESRNILIKAYSDLSGITAKSTAGTHIKKAMENGFFTIEPVTIKNIPTYRYKLIKE